MFLSIFRHSRVNNGDSVSEQAPAVRHNSLTNTCSERSPDNVANSPSMAYGDSSIQDVLKGDVGARLGVEGSVDHDHSTGDHERRVSRDSKMGLVTTGPSNGMPEIPVCFTKLATNHIPL